MSELGADKVSVAFAGLKALSGVDLTVTSGQIVGLIGPNGAGKTTLVNVLTGFQAATEGAVRLDGQPLSALKPHEVRRKGIARTFQGGRLFRDLPVIDNLEVTGVGLGQTVAQRGVIGLGLQFLRERCNHVMVGTMGRRLLQRDDAEDADQQKPRASTGQRSAPSAGG